MRQFKFHALQKRCLILDPTAVLKLLMVGFALLNINAGWAAGIEGQTFRNSVPLADGKKFPLPNGEWVAAVDVNYKDENGTSYNGRLMLNADANAFIPFIIIRQTALEVDWKKTDCDFVGNDQYLVDTFDTKSSDALAKCSHSGTQYNYASLVNNTNAWWSPFSSKFPQIPMGSGEQLITSTNQIKKYRDKVVRYEVFMRPEKLGVTVNDVMSGDSTQSANSINSNFRALNKKFIDAVSESVYGGKSVDIGDVSALIKAIRKEEPSDSPFNKTADELVDASIAVNRGSGSAVGNGSPFNQVDLTATDLQVAAVHAVKKQDDGIVYANRKALVIGNDSYKTVTRLLTAREDAKAIAAGLTRVGYQVTLKTDLDRQGMNAAIRNFKSQVEGGDEIAIFYAGHGVQLSNTNFLLPIDISGETEEQLKDDAVPLQRLLDDIADRHAKFTLALIDACRDNPFKAPNGRSIGGTRGLSPTTAATGQMIVFSAGTGQQALDKLGPNDKDKNGVFTRVLLKQLDSPGVSIDKLVRNVRMEVVGLAKSVGHDQVPAIYDQVVGDFYFRK